MRRSERAASLTRKRAASSLSPSAGPRKRAPTASGKIAVRDVENLSNQETPTEKSETEVSRLADQKWKSWSSHTASPLFPGFGRPTPRECEAAHQVLDRMHHEAVSKELGDPDLPDTIPFVLDAMLVAILSQATSWTNAKRAMNGMKDAYGSVFAYDKIVAGGMDKLEAALRPGGLHRRKALIIMTLLDQVWARHGRWNLDHVLGMENDEAMKQLMSYKHIGPKSAFVVLGWCLKRDVFTVDTHCYRIAGLWGWRPKEANREKTQAHLDAMIPDHLKAQLHFLLIAHGRVCPSCRGGSKSTHPCEAQREIAQMSNTHALTKQSPK